MPELVLAVMPPLVTSEEVTVWVPAVWKVTLRLFVPATKAAFAGSVALMSLEVICTVSMAVFTRFQFASTALTVMLKAMLPLSVLAVPVLPVDDPGAAVSPGTRTCSLVNEPTLIVTKALVFAVMPALVISEAVTVRLPAVLQVTLNEPVPALKAALAGRAALASL